MSAVAVPSFTGEWYHCGGEGRWQFFTLNPPLVIDDVTHHAVRCSESWRDYEGDYGTYATCVLSMAKQTLAEFVSPITDPANAHKPISMDEALGLWGYVVVRQVETEPPSWSADD